MRELKFRAWNGRAMEYGGFSIHASNGKLIPSDITNVGEGAPVMQYTGLKDSEGVDVYEGDVVKIPDSIMRSDGRWDDWLYLCQWTDDCSGFEFRGIKPYVDMAWVLSDVDCEVIGNIHENPELLE